MLAYRKAGGFVLYVAVLVLSWVAPVWAGERVALVIGNAAYAHATALATPVNDAADIGAALERLGFTVTRIKNADQAALRGSLRDFASAAADSEIALVFYAGHGIASDGRNYLVPVDARLSSDVDVEFEAVPLALVERAVARAPGARVIILDASRANPFSAALGPGLAAAEPSPRTLVTYAAAAGTTAFEGESRNSPYTEALLNHLQKPGLELERMFASVREAVRTATGARQEPAVFGSLAGEKIYLAMQPAASEDDPSPAVATEETGASQLTAEMLAAERLYWESIRDSIDPAEIQTYLDQYPDGLFAALARTRLKRLIGTDAPGVPDADAATGELARVEAAEGAQTRPAPAEPETALEPEAVEEALGLQRDHRRLIQFGLASLGFDPGPADGVFGRRTRAAIGKWQPSVDKAATGYLDAEGAKTLAREGNAAAPPTGTQRQAQRRAAMDTLSKALRAAGEIEDHQDRAEALAEIGSVIAKAGDASKAERTFALAVAVAAREDDQWSREYAFSDIAQAQAENGDARSAVVTIERIEEPERRSDTLASIAISQEKAGDAEGAAQTIARAFETAQSITGDGDRVEALTRVASAQVEIGDARGAAQTTERALEIAERITDDTYRNWGFGYIAEAQAKIGRITAALATAQRIAGEYSDSALQNALYDISEAQAEAGDIAGAFATVERITDEFYRNLGLRTIAEAQAEAGDIWAAPTTVERITDKSWRDSALHVVAEAQAEAGDIQAAFATVERITDEASQAHALSAIGMILVEAGDSTGFEQAIERALTAAERNTEQSSGAWAFAHIAGVQRKAGDSDGFVQTIERALASAEEIAEYESRARAFTRIAEVQLETSAR